MPYEDWGPLFRSSPRAFDRETLLRDVERVETNRIYVKATNQAKIARPMKESSDGVPLFYTRNLEELRRPGVISSL